jgi:hypothetical protein
VTRDREGAQLTADPGLEGSIPEREWTAEQVHALALRVLTLGPKTAMELSRRLLRKGVPVGHVEVEVAELQRLGVLDDALYAQLWVDSRVHAKGLARGRLSRELRARASTTLSSRQPLPRWTRSWRRQRRARSWRAAWRRCPG